MTLILTCTNKRWPILDVSSIALSAHDAEGNYYDAGPNTWWFQLGYTSSAFANVKVYNRHAEGSGIDLTFDATATCKGKLQRRNAKPQLLDSYDMVMRLQRTAVSRGGATRYNEILGDLYEQKLKQQAYFVSTSTTRGVSVSTSATRGVSVSWDLGTDDLTLVSCDGEPTIWDSTTQTWWTRSTTTVAPPRYGDDSAPVKVAFVAHRTTGAPPSGRPICADFTGSGADSLLLATSSDEPSWSTYSYVERFFAPSTQPDPLGGDTLAYNAKAPAATTRLNVHGLDLKGFAMYPISERRPGAVADTPGFIVTRSGDTSVIVFANDTTSSWSEQGVPTLGRTVPISGDTPQGAGVGDYSVGVWAMQTQNSVVAQTYVRPAGQKSSVVKVWSAIANGSDTVVQSLAQVTDDLSIGAISKHVLSNEATAYPKNPNLGLCANVYNGGNATNQPCTSVANDPKFASAFRLVRSVSTTGVATGWYQLVGSGPSADECFGVPGAARSLHNGSPTALLPCLPGVSVGIVPGVIDWKVTTAEVYGTVPVGTDISTLTTPPPTWVPLTFTAATTSLVLDLDDSDKAAGTRITVGVANTNSLTQRWVLARTSVSEVLRNAYWNSCDDTWAAEAKNDYGTLQDCDTLSDPRMASFFTEVPDVEQSGAFELQSTVLGTSSAPSCLGVADATNDATPRLAGCRSLTFSIWQWRNEPTGFTGQLQLLGTDMCLDNRNGTYPSHDNTVVVGTCDDTMQSQVWDVIPRLTLARG